MPEQKTTRKRKASPSKKKPAAAAAAVESGETQVEAPSEAQTTENVVDLSKAPASETGPGAKEPNGGAGEPAEDKQASSPAAETGPAAAEAEEMASANRVTIPPTITVRDLAELLGDSPINLIRELMTNGVMANINQVVDFDTAAIVATDLGFEAQEELPPELKESEAEAPQKVRRQYTPEQVARLTLRPPVVTIMGHVDHGKTSLLDVIRETDVVASEAGGITQHIGAYQVQAKDKRITFLDTPGHEAFTAMRARGAMATDIAILVVAADDGVMPQTLEAINHARAAGVPVVVALNKIDKPTANPEAVKKQLADVDLLVEDYGGEVICVPVSAKQKIGLESLLDMILLVAEMADLKALDDVPADGVVIEGRIDKTRGVLATLLVQEGTLRVGDFLVIGGLYGKVRAMFDDKGERIKQAGPSTPVAVLGLGEVPSAGDVFEAVANERTAKGLASEEASRRQDTSEQEQRKAITLDDFFAQAQEGRTKELNIILKADVQGSTEPIVNSVEKLGDESLHVSFLHKGTGNISESDVMLAVASEAIVIGFNVDVDAAATLMADAEGVDVRRYEIIYNLVDDIDKALKGLLEPVYKDVVIGHAQVTTIFRIGRKKQIAGSQVSDGIAARNAKARVLRNDQVLFDGGVSSLRRFKDDVREVTLGMECGIALDGYDDYEEGDVIEFYRKEQARAH